MLKFVQIMPLSVRMVNKSTAIIAALAKGLRVIACFGAETPRLSIADAVEFVPERIIQAESLVDGAIHNSDASIDDVAGSIAGGAGARIAVVRASVIVTSVVINAAIAATTTAAGRAA